MLRIILKNDTELDINLKESLTIEEIHELITTKLYSDDQFFNAFKNIKKIQITEYGFIIKEIITENKTLDEIKMEIENEIEKKLKINFSNKNTQKQIKKLASILNVSENDIPEVIDLINKLGK